MWTTIWTVLKIDLTSLCPNFRPHIAHILIGTLIPGRPAKIRTKKKKWKFFPFSSSNSWFFQSVCVCLSRRLSHFLYFLIRLKKERKKREKSKIYRIEKKREIWERCSACVDEHETECRIWSIPPRLGPLATRSKKRLDYLMISSCPLASNMSFFSFYSNIGNFLIWNVFIKHRFKTEFWYLWKDRCYKRKFSLRL